MTEITNDFFKLKMTWHFFLATSKPGAGDKIEYLDLDFDKLPESIKADQKDRLRVCTVHFWTKKLNRTSM